MENTSNQLATLLAPEVLESNKIISCFNEQLVANISDLSLAPEIAKALNGEKLESYLTQPMLNFLTITDTTVKLNINENLTAFFVLNFPTNYSSSDILGQLPGIELTRIYKKSLYWFLVTESSLTAKNLINLLENLLIGTDKVKYDSLKATQIVSKINKQIEKIAYSKESADLKSSNNNDNNSKLSWRKKSNDTTEEYKNQINKGGFQRSSINNVRDRYNSDGQQYNSTFKPYKKSQEVEIDLSKIHYPLKIKHQFTNGDIILYYDKMRINKEFDEKPKFTAFIPDVCSETKRKDFNFLKRERSNTYSLPMNNFTNSSTGYKQEEIKLNLNAPEFKLPSKNPISTGKLSGIQLNKD